MKITRRLISMIALMATLSVAAGEDRQKKYNVLFIAVDDLNDWVGCLGGNPQAITPNLDKFAAKYGMVMNKAYCPAPLCCPSRSAILTGLRPSTTGIYENGNNLKNAPKAKDAITLPEYFAKNGYHTLSSGKIFHKHPTEHGLDNGEWAFNEYRNEHLEAKGSGKMKKREGAPTGRFYWGKTVKPLEETLDYLTCQWGSKQLLDRKFDKPFFMAIGIAKPHLPFVVPQKFYDMYPLDKLKPVEFHRDDLDDIVRENGKKAFAPTEWFKWADASGKHLEAEQAYLAAVSYVDACLGVLFDALEKSPYRDNTIVMIWGDHGWHLGEKMHYGKVTLWEEATRVPFIVSVPGLIQGGSRTNGVVNLLDMYPTLLELCGLPPNPAVEGRSFASLLKNPKQPWNEPTLTTNNYKNHSVTDGHYRYTFYGGKRGEPEELYDLEKDPMEFTNLISNPEMKPVIERLRKYLPKHDEPISPVNPGGED